MDDWTSKQLPERLPFSKKRLPKRVIFSWVDSIQKQSRRGLTFADISSTTSS